MNPMEPSEGIPSTELAERLHNNALSLMRVGSELLITLYYDSRSRGEGVRESGSEDNPCESRRSAVGDQEADIRGQLLIDGDSDENESSLLLHVQRCSDDLDAIIALAKGRQMSLPEAQALNDISTEMNHTIRLLLVSK